MVGRVESLDGSAVRHAVDEQDEDDGGRARHEARLGHLHPLLLRVAVINIHTSESARRFHAL